MGTAARFLLSHPLLFLFSKQSERRLLIRMQQNTELKYEIPDRLLKAVG
jgi:hypothetical protein